MKNTLVVLVLTPLVLGVGAAGLAVASGAPPVTDPPQADFRGGYGNGTRIASPYHRANATSILYLPPERLAAGAPFFQQKANVFLPPGPAPPDGWPVVFMTLFGGGGAALPVDQVEDDGVPTDRLWEALNAGLAVVNWGAPPVRDGRGMFYPPGHPSGRYESFARTDDSNFKDAEWILQYFKQPAIVAAWNLDPTRYATYASSQGSLNTLWATMGPDRARATGSAQVRTSTRVRAVVAVGAEGSIWAYDQGPTLATNTPKLFEQSAMPGVPADTLSQVDEQLQKDASFSRWMTQSAAARANNAVQPVCLLYVEPVKMVGGLPVDLTLDAFGDPNLHDTIGQPYVHDSWNFLIHVRKLLDISAASYDFHVTQGQSVFALEESVAATLAPPNDLFTDTYTGPIFGTEQTRLGVNFLRRHLLLPLRGEMPLRVHFTDESRGAVSTWQWDFGDGTGATTPHPVHTYTTPGTFAVSLTVTGPGGSDGTTQLGYVEVGGAPSAGLADPSFELQVAGAPPGVPWSILDGGDHLVASASVLPDHGMPSEGDKWLEVSAAGTNDAAPPSNPGGLTVPPVGGAGVGQSFTLEPGAAVLRFDAAFLRNGTANDAAFNDWMSVDVGDGATTWNLFYADTFTPTPQVSARHGLPMTDVVRGRADLATLFPGWTPATVFTLTVQVGNGGDGAAPSRGYVDFFAQGPPAAAVVRNGSGVNPLCYTSTTLPMVGETWFAAIDTAGHPGAGWTLIVGYDQPWPGTATPFGELLVATEALGGVGLFQSLAPSGGGVATHANGVPDDLSLPGFIAYTQGVILGGYAELGNAVDLELGF